jgi:hypothetical protein
VLNWIKYILYFSIFLLVLFLFQRIAMIIGFSNQLPTENTFLEVIHAIVWGFRFDMMIVSYFVIPLILILLLLIFIFPFRQSLFKSSRYFFKIYFPIVALVVSVFGIIDFYFFNFFKTRINILFFWVIAR